MAPLTALSGARPIAPSGCRPPPSIGPRTLMVPERSGPLPSPAKRCRREHKAACLKLRSIRMDAPKEKGPPLPEKPPQTHHNGPADAMH